MRNLDSGLYFYKRKLDSVQHRAAKIIIAVSSTNNEKAEQECGLPPLESRRKLATIKFTNKLRSYGHEDSPRQDKIICSMQTLPRSSTDAQSHLGMPNRRNKVTKNGNGPSEGTLWELLYSPDAPRIAEAVIKTFDGI
ncbi:hypothetical protein TNCV_4610461 [Trichonephila clavipes]|nr:hypothetical protein TNCV_4610461 [Trichonephila clavipes]